MKVVNVIKLNEKYVVKLRNRSFLVINVMSSYYINYSNQDDYVGTLRAKKAVIEDAEITKKINREPNFTNLVLVFLVGALSFAVALSYNNFAQSIVEKYSFGGETITGHMINLVLFTGGSLAILYFIWHNNPQVVELV